MKKTKTHNPGRSAVRVTIAAALLALATLSYSCKKDKPEVIEEPVQQPVTSSPRVLISCEGVFNSANGGVTLYDPQTGNVTEDYFKAQNNVGAGDIVQHVVKINGNFYVTVNNSGKIIVCDNEMKKKGEITGFTSPRRIFQVTSQKAYVTDLFSNKISVINLDNNTVAGTIACNGWTEQMALVGGKLYVTNYNSGKIYGINITTDKIVDSTQVGYGAGSMSVDKNEKIWVLAAGNGTAAAGKLVCVNPSNNSVAASMTFPVGDFPGNLCINATKDTLYYINKDIFRMPVTATSLPGVFIAAGTRSYYGLGIRPSTGEIYAADAIDFMQRSNIYVYNRSGAQATTFKAGINASGFYFE